MYFSLFALVGFNQSWEVRVGESKPQKEIHDEVMNMYVCYVYIIMRYQITKTLPQTTFLP